MVWWKEGVIYQIYPRSFLDSNGDGIGDLDGIRRKLDHLAELGVAGMWISPFFKSPMKDFGYDVADYCDVDPMFGTLDDYDRLLAEAHARDLKVMIDWVPNHSSDQHHWFQEACKSRDNPYRDHYIWRDKKPDGGVPNNWYSVFGGSAWEWHEPTQQYYLHSYLKEQPDLDWRNPVVEQAMLNTLRFWLDRGTDGFRIDVIHRIAKHPDLLDNPVLDEDSAYFGQEHRHDENHPDIHGYLKRIRAVLDEYDDRAMVGEVYLFDPAEAGAYLGDGDELHLAFNFSFLCAAWSGKAFADEVAQAEKSTPATGWPTYVLSNHDQPRHASRYTFGDDAPDDDRKAKLLAAMLITLRGTPFIYYGEEIGLRNGHVPEDRVQDPVYWSLGPMAGRDPERTPMPWGPGPHGGFTTGTPWLPVDASAATRNVDAQDKDPHSVLHFYRALIALRRARPSLSMGTHRTQAVNESLFIYRREADGETTSVVLNFGDTPTHLPDPLQGAPVLLSSHPDPDPTRLAPYEARIVGG